MEFPCLFEIDPDTKESTGTVAPFCSEACRTRAIGTIGFLASQEGTSKVSDFGYTPHCEECGAAIEDSTSGSVGRHDWAIGNPCEDGYPVFVDDRQLSYRRTLIGARALALDIIKRLQADGDYRLNDKPAGFLPPKLDD